MLEDLAFQVLVSLSMIFDLMKHLIGLDKEVAMMDLLENYGFSPWILG